MGCHTWIYKKVSALTPEETEKIVNRETKEAEGWWGFRETHEELVESMKKFAKHFAEEWDGEDMFKGQSPDEYVDDMIKEYTEKRDRIKAEGLSAIVEYEKDSAKIHFEGDIPYYEIGGDGLFRIWGFPEDTFTNKELLLTWLRTINEKELAYYDGKEYVYGYTDELVRRINEYFAKHGEDNLFIEFG